MKQTILEPNFYRVHSQPCPGRLLIAWGLYGFAAALFWQMAGSDPRAQAIVWLLALVLGLGLLLSLEV